MVGEQLAVAIQLLHGCEEGFQDRRAWGIGGFVTGLVIDLGEAGAAKSVAVLGEVDQEQGGGLADLELGGEGAANIADGSEAGDDEGERRGNRLLPGLAFGAVLLPAELHRQ